jgi:hypothetical protein
LGTSRRSEGGPHPLRINSEPADLQNNFLLPGKSDGCSLILALKVIAENQHSLSDGILGKAHQREVCDGIPKAIFYIDSHQEDRTLPFVVC